MAVEDAYYFPSPRHYQIDLCCVISTEPSTDCHLMSTGRRGPVPTLQHHHNLVRPSARIDPICFPYCWTPSRSEIDGIFIEAAAGTEYKSGDPRGHGLAAAFASSWRTGSHAAARNMVEFVCLCQDLDEETNDGESFQLSIPLPGSLSVLVRPGHQHGIPSITLARFFVSSPARTSREMG